MSGGGRQGTGPPPGVWARRETDRGRPSLRGRAGRGYSPGRGAGPSVTGWEGSRGRGVKGGKPLEATSPLHHHTKHANLRTPPHPFSSLLLVLYSSMVWLVAFIVVLYYRQRFIKDQPINMELVQTTRLSCE